MRLIILVSVILLSSNLKAQVNTNGTFILSGEIVGQDTGYVHLNYVNSSRMYIQDISPLKNGKFHFFGSISEPTDADLYWNIPHRNLDDPNFTRLFLEPTKMEGTFKTNEFKDGIIEGSATQREYAIYSKKLEMCKAKWKSELDEFEAAKNQGDQAKVDSMAANQIAFINGQLDSLTYDFIKQYPGSYASGCLLNWLSFKLTLDSLKMFYSLLTPTVQRSQFGKIVESRIAKAEVKLFIGKQAPEFTQTDADGNEISLKDFRGKFVLLDFWASWCVPCREENPYLKAAYAKYHDKGFEIIGFSLDGTETENAWRNAIKKDGLPWIQVCDFKMMGGYVFNEYNLEGKGIPRSFLIDPTGRIVAVDLRGDEVEKKLSEVMN
jgi:peroxiredoxin